MRSLIKRTEEDRLFLVCVVGRAFIYKISQYQNKQPAKYALQNNYIGTTREILRKMSMVQSLLGDSGQNSPLRSIRNVLKKLLWLPVRVGLLLNT